MKVGAFALNLNNAVSNTNWNIGAALSCLHPNEPARPGPTPQDLEIDLPAVEIKPRQGTGQ
jgi:hypothetical protein